MKPWMKGVIQMYEHTQAMEHKCIRQVVALTLHYCWTAECEVKAISQRKCDFLRDIFLATLIKDKAPD